MFINTLFENPQTYFLWITLVVFSVCCHEYAHAQMALWQGDSTAAREGHLTLNPLKQMGLFSIFLLVLLGIAFGMVPTNPSNMRHRYSQALVAFAGPAMNLLLFFFFTAGYALCAVQEFGMGLLNLMFVGALLNIVLFIFNMLPAPPLDGWNIAEYFFPKLSNINPELRNGAVLAIILLAFMFFEYFYTIGLVVVKTLAAVFIRIFQILL